MTDELTGVVTRRIPEQVVHGKRLGRHLRHDPRSRNYRLSTTGLPLKSVLWHRRSPIFDQGQLGSCTGNAMAGALSTKPFRHGFHEPTALRLYELATRIDTYPGSYPPDDTGSDGLSVCKAAVQRGYIARYEHAFGLQDALQALMSGPVITGTDWYDEMDQPDSSGLVHVSGDVRGGHEYEALGVDVEKKLVRYANSWGTGFGDGGYFDLSWDDWALLLSRQGDVSVPIPMGA